MRPRRDIDDKRMFRLVGLATQEGVGTLAFLTYADNIHL